MLVSKPAPRGPDFPDAPLSPISRYVLENMSYFDASRFTDMYASDRELTVRDSHNVLCDTDVGVWAKRWVHLDGRGMSVSR